MITMCHANSRCFMQLRIHNITTDTTCRNEAYKCMAECSRQSAMQKAMVDTKSALGRVLASVQTEEAGRAEQGLAILLACALGE